MEKSSSPTVPTSAPSLSQSDEVPSLNHFQSVSHECVACQSRLDVKTLVQVEEGGILATSGKDEQFNKEYDDLLAEIENCFLNSGDGGIYPLSSDFFPMLHPYRSNLLELLCEMTTPYQIPLCKKCYNHVLQELTDQSSDMKQVCITYKTALDELMNHREETLCASFDPELAKKRLEDLKIEGEQLKGELTILQDEERCINEELDNKKKERHRLLEGDEELYCKLRDNHSRIIDQSAERRCLRSKINYANDQLKRLSHMNVLDMCFFICSDGIYGTINGLRLGRLNHQLVDWQEINAALGQIALLLLVLSQRVELGNQFSGGYEIVPCGSTSYIKHHKHDKVEKLPLFGGGSWRPFGQAGLDSALVAYVECFCHFEMRLKHWLHTTSQIFPYRMANDKIIDKDSQYSVRMQLNSEERWTKAMKCLLQNLKRSIGIVIDVVNPQPSTATA